MPTNTSDAVNIKLSRREMLLAQGKTPFTTTLRKHWLLLAMLLPAVIYVLVFAYAPMSGIVLAFKNYRYSSGIFGSPWVGMKNFDFLFLSGKIWPITRNTILYNLAFLLTETVFQVMFAIMLNEIISKRFRRVSQSLMFLPHFVSWVVVSAIMYNLFNFEKGVLNNLLVSLGQGRFDLYNTPGAWPFLLVFLRLWKGAGYGSVIYLSAIMGQDREMFEAADIDGANIWVKLTRITVPCLKPTIIIMLLLGVGNIFRGDFSLFYQTTGNSSTLIGVTEIIDTYVFRALTSTGDIGMAAAAGFYQSVLCFFTIMVINMLVKWYDPDYSLF